MELSASKRFFDTNSLPIQVSFSEDGISVFGWKILTPQRIPASFVDCETDLFWDSAFPVPQSQQDIDNLEMMFL